jgi:hypothetical protein
MAVGGFGNLTNAIKTRYSSENVEAMTNLDCPFTSWLDKNTDVRMKGGTYKFYAILATAQNMAYHADGGAFPVPKERTDLLLTLNPVLMTGSDQIGEITRYALNDSQSGFNGGEMKIKVGMTIDDMRKHRERCYAATHGTGRLTTVESDGSNTFVAAEHEGVTILKQGMYISVRTTDGGDTVRDSCDGRTIDKLVRATRTVTYSGSDQTLVAGDHVHVVNAEAQTSLSTVYPNGIRGLVDDASFLASPHGQARSSYNQLNAVVNANGGTDREISEAILSQTVTEVYLISGKYPSDGWTSPHQMRMLFKFIQPDRRIVTSGNLPKYQAGHRAADFVYQSEGGPIPFFTAPDMIPREIFLLNKEHLFRYEAKPMGWTDVSPGNLLPLPGTNTYQTSWFMAASAVENIGCNNFQAQAVIRDLRDPMYDGAL